MKQYRIGDYHALTNNCTTLSAQGFNKAFPGVNFSDSNYNKGTVLSLIEKAAAKMAGWPSSIFMPLDVMNLMKNSNPSKINTYHINK